MIASVLAEAGRLLLLLVLAAAPLPLILSVLAVRSAPSPRAWLADRALAVLGLWVVTQALVVTGVGLAGRLFVPELALVESAVAAVGVALLRRRRAAVRRLLGEAATRAAGIARWTRPERFMLSLVAGVGALLLLQELGMPTGDYDSLAYQLPRVVEWYQHGTFGIEPKQWEGWINRYPFAWNTLFFLMVAPLGHDQLALWPNLVAWTMLGLAAYGLARLGGGARAIALAAAAMVMLMPLSVMNVHTAHNDLALGALFAAGAYYTVRARAEPEGPSALLAIALAGAMLGAKTSGLGYTALLAALWLWGSATGSHGGFGGSAWRAARRWPELAVIALASVGLVGASWYVRNLAVAGNPLGFFEVAVMGRVVWPGPVTRDLIDRTSMLGAFRIDVWADWVVLARAMRDHLGWPGLALLAGGLALPRALIRRDEATAARWAAVLLCAASFYLYVAGPWSAKTPSQPRVTAWIGQQMRYSFPFWAVLAGAVGASVRVPAAGAALAVALAACAALASSALYSEFSHRRATVVLLAGIGLGLIALHPPAWSAIRSAVTRSRALPRRVVRTSGTVAVAALVLAVSVVTMESRARRQGVQQIRAGGAARFLASGAGGGRLGFWGTHQVHLLYGADLARRARYLALDEQPSRDAMDAAVRAAPVDVLAVGPAYVEAAASPVWAWLASSPALERVHGDDVARDVVVYRVRRDPPTAR